MLVKMSSLTFCGQEQVQKLVLRPQKFATSRANFAKNPRRCPASLYWDNMLFARQLDLKSFLFLLSANWYWKSSINRKKFKFKQLIGIWCQFYILQRIKFLDFPESSDVNSERASGLSFCLDCWYFNLIKLPLRVDQGIQLIFQTI